MFQFTNEMFADKLVTWSVHCRWNQTDFVYVWV